MPQQAPTLGLNSNFFWFIGLLGHNHIFHRGPSSGMSGVGDRTTLAELIGRSVEKNGFLHVAIVTTLVTAIYRDRDSDVREYWQGVPGEDYLVLKLVLDNPNARVE